jgi:hypothetical protein
MKHNKHAKISDNFYTLSLFSLKNNRLSSANKRWFTGGAIETTLILISTVIFKRHERASAVLAGQAQSRGRKFEFVPSPDGLSRKPDQPKPSAQPH